MIKKYQKPIHDRDGFNCPHCGYFAHQEWYEAVYCGYDYDAQETEYYDEIEDLTVCKCAQCERFSLWIGRKMIFPHYSKLEPPSVDMPKNVKDSYIEAEKLAEVSPRAAAAILRLALQELLIFLGEKNKSINYAIKNLVGKGLPEKIQKSLDIVRVIGNNAVHPGQIDLKDDKKTVLALFELLNLIVDSMLTQPKKVNDMYKKLPETSKEAIDRRDRENSK